MKKQILLLAGLMLAFPLTSCDVNVSSTDENNTKDNTQTVTDPFADIIEWKEDVNLKVPNGETWVRKRQLIGGETYYMRRRSGSQGFKISAQYPDDTYLQGYNEKSISMTMITSWTFCEAKTTWVKFTIKNDNTSSGQTDIYWYSY